MTEDSKTPDTGHRTPAMRLSPQVKLLVKEAFAVSQLLDLERNLAEYMTKLVDEGNSAYLVDNPETVAAGGPTLQEWQAYLVSLKEGQERSLARIVKTLYEESDGDYGAVMRGMQIVGRYAAIYSTHRADLGVGGYRLTEDRRSIRGSLYKGAMWFTINNVERAETPQEIEAALKTGFYFARRASKTDRNNNTVVGWVRAVKHAPPDVSNRVVQWAGELIQKLPVTGSINAAIAELASADHGRRGAITSIAVLMVAAGAAVASTGSGNPLNLNEFRARFDLRFSADAGISPPTPLRSAQHSAPRPFADYPTRAIG